MTRAKQATVPYHLGVALLAGLLIAAVSAFSLRAEEATAATAESDTYTIEEIFGKAEGFFGDTSEGLAKAIEKVFAEQGRPNAFITGEEVSGAIGVGLRYGKGTLNRKGSGGQPVFWQGPSIGWDFGGNASKVFALIYNLNNSELLFQRYPGVEGSIYVVGGFGVNYQRSGDITIAPIRTGAGLRAGANVGYLHYGKEHSWIPF